MIPFPGESAELDWANVTAGSPFGDDGEAIRYRADSATVTSGDAFVVGFFDHNYLEAGSDAVFSFVVETLAGSSGTLSLTGGPDPDFTLEDANASVYDLGDHVVSGESTLVVELPWVTVADYLDGDVETAVRVECTAGSVVIQQVKLRIWPPGGAPGGWSATPYVQDAEEKAPEITDTSGVQTGFFGTPAAMRADAAALVTGPLSFLATNYISSGQVAIQSVDPGDPTNSGTFGVTYIGRRPSNLTGPGFEEETWIVPPNEVHDDEDRVIFQPTGDDTFAWTQGTATLVNESAPLVTPAAGLFHIDATEVAEFYPLGTNIASFVEGAAFATHSGEPGVTYTDLALPEFDAELLLVTIWHDGHFLDIADGGTSVRLVNGITTDEVEFDNLRFMWTPAPYRYWNPTAEVITKLRQFHRDDGLGVTPPRAFGGASRIRTGRAYGYD